MIIVFGTVLPWLLIAIGTWLAYELVRQNGRILLRLEAIEQQFGLGPRRGVGTQRPEAGGLQFGAVAPDFELPDLAGVRHKLSEFRERNVLLVFFNPQCGYCTQMAADLAALPAAAGNRRAVPVVVTTGDAARRTGSWSSVTAFVVWSSCRSKWRSPRSIKPREHRWDIGSTARDESPAS